MADAKLLRQKSLRRQRTRACRNSRPTARAVLFDGWLKADPAARGEDVELPKVSPQENLDVKDVSAEEKQTTPPQRYSEAGLIKGIGKTRHRAPLDLREYHEDAPGRGYVLKEGRSLIPTDTGDVVSTFLEDNFPTYISDTFTAEMEDRARRHRARQARVRKNPRRLLYAVFEGRKNQGQRGRQDYRPRPRSGRVPLPRVRLADGLQALATGANLCPARASPTASARARRPAR